MKDDPFTTRVAELDTDMDRVLEVWRDSPEFGQHPAEKFHWFYCGAPWGPGIVVLLSPAGSARCIGVAGIGTRRLVVDGRSTTAGLLADFAVLPGYRSLMPAMVLQKAARRIGLERYAWVYGMPNPKAVPVFKRLGYALLAQLWRHARVVRHAPYLARRMPEPLARLGGAVLDAATLLTTRVRLRLAGHGKIVWLDAPDARFDALWTRVAAQYRCIAVRDADFLRWRFLMQPGAACRFFTIERPDDSVLLAYAVCERQGEVLHVRDLLAERDAYAWLLRALAIQAYHLGATRVSVEFGGDAQVLESLAVAGFVRRSERAVYGATADGERRLDGSTWYLTSADEDQ